MFIMPECTHILQHTGRYLFNPAVITHDQIEGGSINTSFYTLAGANFGAEVVQMEPILAEVCRCAVAIES